MITKWYGPVLGLIMGILLFIKGLGGRWSTWTAVGILLISVAMALYYRSLQRKLLIRKIILDEILKMDTSDKSRIVQHTTFVSKVIHYLELSIACLLVAILIYNWRYFSN